MTDNQIDDMLDVLRNFPADGLLTSSEAVANCKAMGFVTERHQEGRCQHCGSSRVERRWHVVTPAGRALLALAERSPIQPTGRDAR